MVVVSLRHPLTQSRSLWYFRNAEGDDFGGVWLGTDADVQLHLDMAAIRCQNHFMDLSDGTYYLQR